MTTNSNTKKRCEWCLNNKLMIKYHDEEWGVPVYDDAKQFEFLTLEGAQAGLSWDTVLKKRENYREVFKNWDVKKIAKMTETEIATILENPGIIRNKLKVNSVIKNAKAFINIQKEFGTFSDYIWNFMPNKKPLINKFKKMSDLPAETEISKLISKDLKKRGFTFVGPTIIYAHMQATGMVNDHVMGCFKR